MKPYDETKPKGQQIESMFNTIAPRYDLLNRLMSLGIDRLWRRSVVRRAKGAKSILDVATGTGDMAMALARNNKKARITGVDISEGMLDIAREKIARKGLVKRVTFVHGAAEELPFKDAQFDAVTVAFGVRNFENIAKGVEQMLRVTRKGGKVYVLEFSTPKSKFFGTIYHLYFHKIVPLLGGCISGDKKAYDYLPRSVEEFPTEQNFVEIMRRVGYESVEVVRLTFGVANIYIGKV